MQPEIEVNEGQSFDIFKPISYRSQLVNGQNYLIKVQIGEDEFLHMKAYKPFSFTDDQPSLVTYETEKSLDDPLDPNIEPLT